MMESLWKTVWCFHKKLKIELPYDPAILLLGIYLDKTIIQKDTHIPMFTTMRYHLTPVKMTVIRKSKNDKYWQGCGGKEVFVHCR